MPKDLDNELGDGLFAIGPDGQPLDLAEILNGAAAGGPDEMPEEGERVHGDLTTLFDEGTPVSITAQISPARPEELTIIGTVVGISILPGGHPFAPETPAYIVKVDDPSTIPADDDGEQYRWSCLTFPVEMCVKVEDETPEGDPTDV